MRDAVLPAAFVARIIDKVRDPAIPYVLGGRSERGTDCINLIGWCLDELDARTTERGSNSSWRKDYAWCGTLDEAERLGYLVPGAVLFIDYGDGAMDHAGVYIGSGHGITTPDGKPADGVHASQSRGGVYGSTLANGWTHVALLLGVDYGLGDSGQAEAGEDETDGGLLPGQARVTTEGGTLTLRKIPSRSGAPIRSMPNGAVVEVLDLSSAVGWARVRFIDERGTVHVGWCASAYLDGVGEDLPEEDAPPDEGMPVEPVYILRVTGYRDGPLAAEQAANLLGELLDMGYAGEIVRE